MTPEREAVLARIASELMDTYDEELELEIEDEDERLVAAAHAEPSGRQVRIRTDTGETGAAEATGTTGTYGARTDRTDTTTDARTREALHAGRMAYFRELFRLQGELVKLQDWVQHTRQKTVIVFEGRDAAGKGGVIKRITQRLNPRICRVVALPAPNDRERTQWYFQRYAPHLPAAGEMVLFDRSWYNRAGVERVMGFCTDDEYEEFFRSVPEFERMLVRSGIRLIKYWFSITDDEQHLRFLARIHDPLKQWKLSPMDLESRRRWEAYTKAKETMLERSHIPEAPWWVVQGVDKKKARLNCIAHLLAQFDYHDIERPQIALPPRERNPDYIRRPVPMDMFVPERY